jgi:hypothetical protein
LAGSFDWVDDKVKEADFFLEKLRESGLNFNEARFYFSAFVTASRSITFVLQSVLSDHVPFKSWYEAKQAQLKSDPLSRFFLEVRNEVQKRGSNPITTLHPSTDRTVEYFFMYWYGESPKDVPDLDVVTACEHYLSSLVKLVYECYRDFGATIDPEQYYTTENLNQLGLSIDDVLEQHLGFPRGWIEGADPEEVLRYIRNHEPKPRIDDTFVKYLGHDRLGNQCAP